MPYIKQYRTDWDFKHTKKYADHSINYFFFIKDNVLVEVELDNNDNAKKISQEPIRVSEEDGIQLWANDDKAWISFNDHFQEAYSNYLAEKALLKEGNND